MIETGSGIQPSEFEEVLKNSYVEEVFSVFKEDDKEGFG